MPLGRRLLVAIARVHGRLLDIEVDLVGGKSCSAGADGAQNGTLRLY